MQNLVQLVYTGFLYPSQYNLYNVLKAALNPKKIKSHEFQHYYCTVFSAVHADLCALPTIQAHLIKCYSIYKLTILILRQSPWSPAKTIKHQHGIKKSIFNLLETFYAHSTWL